MKDLMVHARNAATAAKALEAGFTRLILDEAADGLGRVDVILRRDDTLERDGRRVGRWVALRTKADEHRAAKAADDAELVVVDAADWKVIPLENLIAAIAGRSRLYAVARTIQEAELFLTTLERGVDGIVVDAGHAKDLSAFRTLVEKQARGQRALVAATITRIEPVGMGERVCIDTVSILTEGEGMLIGSSSQGFFLVAAETKETEFVRARPFRVNAGAVHSYILNGTKTRYLSELESGETLEAVDSRGSARPVVVGRLKIETRPLLLVEAEVDGRRYRAILQNAETIRLVPPDNNPVSVTKLEVGQRVLMHLETSARHFGMPVEERLEER